MKKYKPTTKSRRFMTTLPYRDLLSGDAPHKPLLKKNRSKGGRNAFGRITVRHQGGGHKRQFRDVDRRDDTSPGDLGKRLGQQCGLEPTADLSGHKIHSIVR